jgi:hypothetical protein
VATVGELSDPYANFMRTPGRGSGCCTTCTTFVEPAYQRCYQCNANQRWLAAVLPISYAKRGGQLHTNLAGYKRWAPAIAERARLQLAAVLWRFVVAHEGCLAIAAGVGSFDLVTTVPSSDPARDERHPLRTIVGQIVEPTRDRHERVLRRSAIAVEERGWDPRRFTAVRALAGERVLLVDDTWTTGARAQTAAAALLTAGASTVAALVIGRFINPGFADNAARLAALPRAFSWDTCGLHEP